MQTVDDTLLPLSLLQGNGSHADNTVHRSAYLMAHAGEELRLGPAGNVMLLLVHLSLNHTAQLCQILILLRIVQQVGRKPQNTDAAHIISAVIHRQHNALILRPDTQETLNNSLSAVPGREVPHLLLAQPCVKVGLVLLLIFAYTVHGILTVPAPLVIQVAGIKIGLQQRHQHAVGLVEPADLANHQLHLGRKVRALSKQVQRHRHQPDIPAITQGVDLLAPQGRQSGCFDLLPVKTVALRLLAVGCAGQPGHADQPIGTPGLVALSHPNPQLNMEGLLGKSFFTVVQQTLGEFLRLLFTYPLQPQDKLVPV